MKNLLLSFCLILIFNSESLAQNKFQAKYSGIYQMGDHMSNVLSDGSIVFCYDLIDPGGSGDIGLVRIDTLGAVIWSKRYSGSSGNSGYFPIETSDHCIVLSGRGPGGTTLLTKIDINGNVMWSKSASNGLLTFNLPVETHDKGFAVYASDPNGPSTYATYLLRTDSAGNFLWGKSYGASNTGPGKLVIETADHGFLITSSIQTTHAEDLMVIKTDSAGTLEWVKQFGTSQNDIPYSGSQMNDGGYLISFSAVSNGLHLLKLSSNGTMEWVKNYSNIFIGKFSCITDKNDIVVVGTGYDIVHSIASTVLVKTDSVGNLIWNRFYSHEITSATLNIAPDKGYVLLMPNYTFDTLTIVKTDEEGNSGCEETIGSIQVIVPTFFEDTVLLNTNSIGSVVNYTMTSSDVVMDAAVCNTTSIEDAELQNQLVIFPNPANNQLNILNYFDKEFNYLIYDIYGQEVIRKKSYDGAAIDVTVLNDGIYFIRLDNNISTITKSFVVEH